MSLKLSVRERVSIDYFLIVSDLVRWAKGQGIAVGQDAGLVQVPCLLPP